MVVKEDGTKWSCQSCLKGHRVSACHHTDRELTLVPKKGRPVTQCQHCRLERKKRSAHVKCDCGESDKQHHPREKCIHLREAEERAKAGQHEENVSDYHPVYLAHVAEEQGCCCHHGGKCTCAILTRESDESGAIHGPAVKPRLDKTCSEGAITVFTNGHHKPVHRKNHAAHESGLPYKMPVPRTPVKGEVSSAPQESIDHLTLDPFNPALYTGVPFNTSRRKSRSEQPSPKLSSLDGFGGGVGDMKLSPVDFSTLSQSQTNSSMQSFFSDGQSSQLDPTSGLTESSYDPWSAFPSTDTNEIPTNGAVDLWPTFQDNYSLSQPALTAASSGTRSEVDDIPAIENMYSVPSQSFLQDANMMPSALSEGLISWNRRSLPPGFFGNAEFEMAGFTSDWQAPVSDCNDAQFKLEDTATPGVGDSWQMPSTQPSSSVPIRALGRSPFSSRPQSRSLGSDGSPSDDIMKQLFPEMDIDTATFTPTVPASNPNTMADGRPKASITSAPVYTEPIEDNSFTTQAWIDGSMVMPHEPFDSSCDVDPDFSNTQFSIDWAQ